MLVSIVSQKVIAMLTHCRAPPCPPGLDANSVTQLRRSLVSFTFRIQSRLVRTWVVEVVEFIALL